MPGGRRRGRDGWKSGGEWRSVFVGADVSVDLDMGDSRLGVVRALFVFTLWQKATGVIDAIELSPCKVCGVGVGV